MPRPERPVDPEQGPVARFATELRALREKAGSPPYRRLAEQAHFSKATLADAARGHRLPTLEVTLAYVEACGGDAEQWRARWHEVRSELRLPPLPEPQPFAEPITEPLTEPPAEPPAEPTGERTRARRVPLLPVLGALALLTVIAVTVTVAVLAGDGSAPRPSEPVARFAGSSVPVGDNADPKETGCSYDAAVATIDSIEVNTSDRHFLGVAELRYSPRCRAAWGRFTPSDRLSYLRGSTVSIVAHRPATGTKGVPYTTSFDGQAVFGNILLAERGCLQITVIVRGLAGTGSASTLCKP
jgi:hypothetical protein